MRHGKSRERERVLNGYNAVSYKTGYNAMGCNAVSKNITALRRYPFGKLRAGSLQHPRGFTLLELLIVVAMLAIIAVVVTLILNPAETLRRGRDSQRLSDLSSLKTALALYILRAPNPDLDGVGNPSGICGTNIWIGRPTGSADITDTSVSGRTLAANGDSTSAAIDGSGWIPVNFTEIPEGSPIAALPVDPNYSVASTANIVNTDRFYRYSCGTDNTFELVANMESAAFSQGGGKDKESTDGGSIAGLLEVGAKLSVIPGEYKAFVSSSQTSSGNLGGLSGADSTCQSLANAVPSLAGITWKAWLSDGTTDARDRLVQPASPIYLVDGTKIADDWNDLIDGTLDAPLSKTENNTLPGEDVWTGTNTNGTKISHCSSWTSSDSLVSGTAGRPTLSDGNWTFLVSYLCNSTGVRFYCFSQSPL